MSSKGYILPTSRTQRYAELTLDAIEADEYVVIPDGTMEQRADLNLWARLKSEGLRDYILLRDVGSGLLGVIENGNDPLTISLRDQSALKSVFGNKNILIDISGFSYHIWAPILKVAFENKIHTRILYSEPESYSPHDSPASSTLFDLSKEYGGLSPLPGFVQLFGPDDNQECLFVALLGFEGNRPRSLLYNFDPLPKVIPVVGVPGFQIEFPSFTVKCNSELLEESQAYYDIRYAKASCPFDAYRVLEEVRRDNPESYLYIAPVGTKPHGLGAILYSIMNPESTEILFDHPVKKHGRTKGVGISHIYDFEDFHGFG